MATPLQSRTETLLREARAGALDQLGTLLTLYTNYLRFLALAQFEQRLRGRVSPSDVVQETFYEAHRDFRSFRGSTAPEFAAWLRRILINNLYRVMEQHLQTEKRDVRREISLEQLTRSLEQSTTRLGAIIPDRGTSPSERIQREELQILMADQITMLPDDYRQVVVLRHIEGLPFEEIAQRMGRTSGAVRMLWLRAIRLLRERLRVQGVG